MLGVFSVSASAEELEISPYYVKQSSFLLLDKWYSYGNLYFTPNDETETIDTKTQTLYNSDWEQNNRKNLVNIFEVIPHDESTIAKADIKTTFKLENVYSSFLMHIQELGLYQYVRSPFYVYAQLNYVDGTSSSSIDATWVVKPDGSSVNLSVTCTPDKEVRSIQWQLYYEVIDTGWYSQSDRIHINAYQGEHNGDNKYNFTVQQPSEEAGLLQGIWGQLTSGFNALGDKISSVFTAITDGFKNLGNKVTEVVNSILELPRKIWGFIEDGLKSLFIPSTESFQELKSNFDSLLADKLGALYEVGTIIFDFWENILIADERNAIDIPEVEIPIGSEKTFTFGGYSVPIVPEGFLPIALTSKLITSIIATFAYLNALKKKYEELLRT